MRIPRRLGDIVNNAGTFNRQHTVCSVTGQTPLFCGQMQDWANQNIFNKEIECYCLDAPLSIPMGATHATYSVPAPIWKSRDYDDWF